MDIREGDIVTIEFTGMVTQPVDCDGEIEVTLPTNGGTCFFSVDLVTNVTHQVEEPNVRALTIGQRVYVKGTKPSVWINPDGQPVEWGKLVEYARTLGVSIVPLVPGTSLRV